MLLAQLFCLIASTAARVRRCNDSPHSGPEDTKPSHRPPRPLPLARSHGCLSHYSYVLLTVRNDQQRSVRFLLWQTQDDDDDDDNDDDNDDQVQSSYVALLATYVSLTGRRCSLHDRTLFHRHEGLSGKLREDDIADMAPNFAPAITTLLDIIAKQERKQRLKQATHVSAATYASIRNKRLPSPVIDSSQRRQSKFLPRLTPINPPLRHQITTEAKTDESTKILLKLFLTDTLRALESPFRGLKWHKSSAVVEFRPRDTIIGNRE